MKPVSTALVALLLPALLVVAPAPAAAAVQDTLVLSLEDALRIARANNPGFLAARNDAEVAAWEVRSALGQLLPSASASTGLSWQGAGEQRFGSLTAEQLGFADQPSYYFSSYSLGLGYQLDGTTLLQPRQARRAADRTEAQIRSTAVALDQQVTNAYLEGLRQQEEVTLAQAQLERSRFNLRLAEAQRDVGQVTAIDVQQAEVQVGRGEVAVLRAEQALLTARLRLVQRLGVPLTDQVVLTTTFGIRPPAYEEEDLYRLALERNPTLNVRRAGEEVAEVQVGQARSTYFPSLSLSAGLGGFTRQPSSTTLLVQQAEARVLAQRQQCLATNELYRRLADPLPLQDCSVFSFGAEDRARVLQANDAFPFDFTRQPASVSLTVSLPLFQGLSRQRQLETAEAALGDARLQVREQELALRADIEIAVGEVRTAYRTATIEDRNRDLADEQLRLARERYRVGQIPFVDLVDAETVKAEADRQYVSAVFAYHDAIAALEALVGTSLREPAGPGEIPPPDPQGGASTPAPR